MTPARRQAIFEALESVRAHTDMAARREADPVGIVHRYADPEVLVAVIGALSGIFNKGLLAGIPWPSEM